MGVVIWYGRIPSSYGVGGIPLPVEVAVDDQERLWPLLLLKVAGGCRRIRRLVLQIAVSFPHLDHNPRPSDEGNALRICQDAMAWGAIGSFGSTGRY